MQYVYAHGWGRINNPLPPPPRCRRSGNNTAPMGGHRIVTRNGPADLLSTKMVEDGPARRVFDDELKQLYRRIGKATSGIDERR